MIITKGDILLFLQYCYNYNNATYLINDRKFINSVNELGEIVDRFFLYAKPKDYILEKWEIKDCFKSESLDRYYNLEPLFLSFIRESKLDIILV